MARPISITIIVPVYDEEYNAVPNIEYMISWFDSMILSGIINDYELVVLWGTKRQSNFLKDCQSLKGRIKIFIHDKMELGSMFVMGIRFALNECVGFITPYNQYSLESLEPVLKNLREHDMVVAYIKNPKSRPWYRVLASYVNTLLVNLLFGLRVRYYHQCFYRSCLVKKVKFTTSSHAAMVEAAVWMAKSGADVIQVPVVMNTYNFRSKSRAFRIENITDIFKTYLRLFWHIQILRKRINLN